MEYLELLSTKLFEFLPYNCWDDNSLFLRSILIKDEIQEFESELFSIGKMMLVKQNSESVQLYNDQKTHITTLKERLEEIEKEIQTRKL